MKTETVEVEECYCCQAPDPKGVVFTDCSGPNRDKTFRWCRTCWETGATAVVLYPRQFKGESKAVQVMCNIEQRRRLKDGYYD